MNRLSLLKLTLLTCSGLIPLGCRQDPPPPPPRMPIPAAANPQPYPVGAHEREYVKPLPSDDGKP